MNNKKLVIIIAIAMLAFLVWKLLPLSGGLKLLTDRNKIYIAATISPIADIAKNVGGDKVLVSTILPPGASPHTFEPTAQDAIALQKTKLIFAVGHGLDNWIKPLADNAKQATVVTVDRGINLLRPAQNFGENEKPLSDADPHYWLTIPNAKLIASVIADELKRADPTHAADYGNNLAKYLGKLDQTDAYIRTKLINVTNRNLVTQHNAWNYFTKAYGLKVVGTFEANPGQEPTAKQLADLQATVKSNGISTVYIEPQESDQTIQSFVKDLNLKVATLNAEGSADGMGYIELMRYNADTITNHQITK